MHIPQRNAPFDRRRTRSRIGRNLLIFVSGGITCTLVAFGAYFLFGRPSDDLVVVHGPNPSTDLTPVETDDLQARVQRWFSSTKYTRVGKTSKTTSGTSSTVVTPPIVTTTIVPVVATPTPNPAGTTAASATNTVASNLGIAAGGALIYLGQPELDIYFKNLRDLGMAWVRCDIAWNVIQANGPNQYDWEGADRIMATAKKYNIRVLGIITYAPSWASNPGACNSEGMCVPNDPNTFATFAGLVAARYKGSLDYFEIWNEPNYTFFWKPKPNIDTYVSMLKGAYTEIKKANPDAIVLAGALASTGDEADGSIAPITFVRGLYAAGTRQYFDALSVHPYTYPASPDYVADWNSWQQIATIRQMMVDNGDGAKKIWITEYGASTGGPGKPHELNQLSFTYGVDYMSEKAQQQTAQYAIAQYRKDAAIFGPFFWYSLKDDGINKTTPENFFGLIRYDNSKKPVYDVFRQLIASGTQM